MDNINESNEFETGSRTVSADSSGGFGPSRRSRRSAIRTLGAAVVAGGTLSTAVFDDVRAESAANNVSTASHLDEPIWYSMQETHWHEQNPDDFHEEGGLSMRRVLFLQDFGPLRNSPGYHYEFGLTSMGVVVANPQPNSLDPHPSQAFHSNHEIRFESDDINVGHRLAATQPLIKSGLSDDDISEVPDEDDWLAEDNKWDLEDADVDAGNESIVLGGVALVAGLIGIPVSGGASVALSGTSAGLSLTSLTSALADQGTEYSANEDRWMYEVKETEGFFVTQRRNIGGFMHSVRFDIDVMNDETPEFTVTDEIEDNGDAGNDNSRERYDMPADNDELVSRIDDNEDRHWTIWFPSNRGDHSNRTQLPQPKWRSPNWGPGW